MSTSTSTMRTTRYLTPTNTRGSRVKIVETGRVYAWNYALDVRDNHAEAVRMDMAADGLLPDDDTPLVCAGESETRRGYVFLV